MKITLNKLPKSETEIRVEVSSEEFQNFYNKAVLLLGENLEINGFRKGKASKEMVEKEIGVQKILEEAASLCVRENYTKAIQENKIEPLSQPQVEVLKLAAGNPFEFKARVAVFPEIRLPDYKKIVSQIKKKRVELTQEEINKLKEEKERMEKERLREEILSKISERSLMEVPRVLVEEEKKRMLADFKRQVMQMLQISFEDYLKKVNKTEKEILESLDGEAERKVRNTLVLKKIEKEANIGFTDQELAQESEKIEKQYPEATQFDREQLKEYAKEVIKNEKTFQILESLVQ